MTPNQIPKPQDSPDNASTHDTFVESRDPSELVMCVILSAAYAGLARFCWGPLHFSSNLRLIINIEGFLITISLLSLLVGLRPYLTPSSLQISPWGLKYRGPYWPQLKSVSWQQISRIYISPELVILLYRPNLKQRAIWALLIQSVYLSDHGQLPLSLKQYCPMEPIMLKSPSWATRLLLVCSFSLLAVWILQVVLDRLNLPHF